VHFTTVRGYVERAIAAGWHVLERAGAIYAIHDSGRSLRLERAELRHARRGVGCVWLSRTAELAEPEQLEGVRFRGRTAHYEVAIPDDLVATIRAL
jgi:hypothetical protein